MYRIVLMCGLAGTVGWGPAGEIIAAERAAEPAVQPDSKSQRWSSLRRVAKSWLRTKTLAAFHRMKQPPESRPYGMKWDDDSLSREADRPLVVAVHGLHSGSHLASSLVAGPRSAGYPCGTFDYPNDQSITHSARLLSGEIRRFGDRYPGRKVALVTHSMGGIVARAVIEDARLDPGNVSHLIMIAPPNQGSNLAYCNLGADVVEYMIDERYDGFVELVYRSVEDGLAEGPRELRPGSSFLSKLNRRKRNPEVHYTIVLGTNGPLTSKQLAALQRRAARMGEKGKWRGYVARKSGNWLSKLDETVKGKGDGAVAVSRGRLAGVTDTVEFDFAHTDVLRTPIQPHVQPVHDLVLDRLAR